MIFKTLPSVIARKKMIKILLCRRVFERALAIPGIESRCSVGYEPEHRRRLCRFG